MLTLESSLSYHLQHNHYPPVPLSMVPVCLAAINKAVECDWQVRDEWLSLPDGVTYMGMDEAPVIEIIEQHHLGNFVDACMYENEQED